MTEQRDVTLELVTKELFLMNWEVMEVNSRRSYAQKLSVRLRKKDPLLADMRRLVSMIRARGNEFVKLYEENRENVTGVLNRVAGTAHEYGGLPAVHEGKITFTTGFGPTTLVEMTGAPNDPCMIFMLPCRPHGLNHEQSLNMVNRLIDEELAAAGHQNGAFKLQYRDDPANECYRPELVPTKKEI